MPNTTYGTPYAQSSDLVSNWPGVSLNVADRIDDVSFKGNGLNDQTGTTYTLVLTDAGKTVTLDNASAVTVTVPTNASVAYEIGTVIEFTNKGAGVVTISPAGGVTLNNSVTLAQNASAAIQKLDTNTWVMIGAPAPGLTLITASSFSAASSVSINNCFTSTYANYRLLWSGTSSNSDIGLYLRLRASSSDNTSSNYNYVGLYTSSTPALALDPTVTTTFFQVGGASSATGIGQFTADVFGPQLTDYTSFMSNYTFRQTATKSQFGLYGGNMTVTTAYDGFTLYTSAGTMSGTVRVYGYRN